MYILCAVIFVNFIIQEIMTYQFLCGFSYIQHHEAESTTGSSLCKYDVDILQYFKYMQIKPTEILGEILS